MAWTAPRTWVVGEVVTAALGNTHWRDNLRYLKGLDGVPTIESGLIIDNTGGDEYLQIPSLTTTERDALTPVNGMVIYNETTTEFNKYENGGWKDLGGGVDHGGLDGLADDDHTQYQKENLLTTQGDMVYATAASTWARLAKGTGLQQLRTNSGATAPEWFTASSDLNTLYKASDETVNNSAALQNDDDLVFAIAANNVFDFSFKLHYLTGYTPDFKVAITVPAAATVYFQVSGIDIAFAALNESAVGSGTSVTLGGDSSQATAATEIKTAIIEGVVVNGANVGNVQLQWAQNTATVADTKVKAGSCVKYIQLA